MPGSILNRLIFWELVKVFLLSLGTLTGLLVMAGLTQQASQMGLSLSQALRAIPLFVPNMLPYTIPATTLFASCVVYGRLAHDNEVVAIKAAGVHLITILKPALLLGIITTTLTASLYHTVIPRSQQLLYKQFVENPEELIYTMLRRDRCIRHPSLPYVLYVRDVQGKRLIDVVIKRRAKFRDPTTGQESLFGYDYVARAREARLRVDVAEGKLYVDPDRFVIWEKNVEGSPGRPGPLPMDLPEGVNGKDTKIRVSAITWDELPERMDELRDELDAIERRWEENRQLAQNHIDPARRLLAQGQERHFKYQVDAVRRTMRNTEAEFFMRPALACGCLIFALIGCPVGIWANRADYLSTFVICFIPTLLIYYPLIFAGSNLGKDGKIPLWLGCWMGNAVVGVAGVVLNARLLRR